jgi:hypothetical protein
VPTLRPAVEEVREKFETLKTVVVDPSLLENFNSAVCWTTRGRDAVDSCESGRFERAAVALSASAAGYPRIEPTFSESRYILDDHRMHMKPTTINAGWIMAGNIDLGRSVLLNVVQQ